MQQQNVDRNLFRTRRGVASVLSMMFLVIFGSLAVAMAVVAQGNLRTAASTMRVSRAMSAAETGLVFASRRLQSEAKRFVVEKGVIDTDYAEDLWLGNWSSADGEVVILDPVGYTSATPNSLLEAVFYAHSADTYDFEAEAGDDQLPAIDDTYGSLYSQPIPLQDEAGSPYFRLKYELLSYADTTDGVPNIRITSQGVDGDVTRTLQMDFALTKKIEFAVISPNRIMIGKNVRVEGPLGSRYGVIEGELDTTNGDPLVMRTDFRYLNATLDGKLDTLYAQIVAHDVDGDARLRPDHPTESQGLSGQPDLIDYNGDEYVDDFDLFMSHYDANDDKVVVYDNTLTNEVGLGSPSEEFAGVDDQLARLIDTAVADRDGDGDVDYQDRQLGYNDGLIDDRDLYAKVHGRLAFAVAKDDWETANGDVSYQTITQGPIRPETEQAAVSFEVSDEEMREITTDMFVDNQTWFDTNANGAAFADQVSAQGGSTGTQWETVPYNAPGHYDVYNRPVYEDMTFTNVRIPKGTNALFKNCTFVGATYVESNPNCENTYWNFASAEEWIDDGDGIIEDDEVSIKYDPLNTGDDTVNAENQDAIDSGALFENTKPESNNIRFDGCTFLGSISGETPGEYTHWRNKLQFTGNTRFYIDVEDPDLADQADSATLISSLESLGEAQVEELSKSSILMPGWSIDVGSFTNETSTKVKLKGTIISGILDVRGNVDVFGTLVMTFRPTEGAGPLFFGGQTDVFNTTIGYFGPDDGDEEGVEAVSGEFGEITLRYNPDGKLPDGIPWPIKAEPAPITYIEGGAL